MFKHWVERANKSFFEQSLLEHKAQTNVQDKTVYGQNYKHRKKHNIYNEGTNKNRNTAMGKVHNKGTSENVKRHTDEIRFHCLSILTV